MAIFNNPEEVFLNVDIENINLTTSNWNRHKIIHLNLIPDNCNRHMRVIIRYYQYKKKLISIFIDSSATSAEAKLW